MNVPRAKLVANPRPVDISDIEKELEALWRHPDVVGKSEEPLTRACMSNLIIYTPSIESAKSIPAEVESIVQIQPSRVLLLVGELNTSGVPVPANVSAFCGLIGEEHQQVFSEFITIGGASGAARRLPSVARALLIGDLPTALWWATNQPPPEGGGLFQELSGMADQVIYECQGWLDPVKSVIAVAQWAANERAGQVLADLEWRRLKWWRRLISQALDPAVVPGAMESITEVRLEHGPHALPKSWLLIGWLACRLGWKPAGGKVVPGVDIVWRFNSPSGPVKITIHRLSEGEPKVVRGSITYKTGPKPETVNFIRLSAGRLGIVGEDPAAPPRVQVVPSYPRAALIARQLPDLGKDALFRETLQVSRTMAEALLH